MTPCSSLILSSLWWIDNCCLPAAPSISIYVSWGVCVVLKIALIGAYFCVCVCSRARPHAHVKRLLSPTFTGYNQSLMWETGGNWKAWLLYFSGHLCICVSVTHSEWYRLKAFILQVQISLYCCHHILAVLTPDTYRLGHILPGGGVQDLVSLKQESTWECLIIWPQAIDNFLTSLLNVYSTVNVYEEHLHLNVWTLVGWT